MENNNKITYSHVMEKKKATIVEELSKKVKKIIDHKSLQKIISLTEEEEGID